ncbi:TonB-dependent receptor [Methylosinus sp. 3S-1]|nr:TonB-dependent receptor [Methylosinus sp. 3S-1]
MSSRTKAEKQSAGVRRPTALLLTTTILCAGALVATTARAQGSAPTQNRMVSFAIPAQPLPAAIDAFIRATGWQVGYPSRIADGLTSTPVSGAMPPAQALRSLLAGTGLGVRFTGSTTATLTGRSAAIPPAALGDAVPLDVIDVGAEGAGRAYVATRSVAGAKVDTPLIETPQTISVVTRKELDQRAVQDFAAAVAYTPGIAVVDYPGGPGAPDYSLRGFRDVGLFGVYRDGLRAGFNNYDTNFEPFGLERVDVVKGPSSVLYGQTSPGGLVNLTTKRPTAAPLHEIALQTGSYGRRQIAVDFGGPVDSSGDALYRFTGLFRNAGTQIDHAPDDRLYLAPSVTLRPAEKTEITLLASYFKLKMSAAEQSIPRSALGIIGTNVYLGVPGQSNWNVENISIGYRLDHELNADWSLRQNARYMHSKVDFRYAYSAAWPVELVDGHYYPVGLQDRPKSTNTYLIDTNIQGRAATGPVSHTLLAGLDYAYYTGKESRRNSLTTLTIDVLSPVYPTTNFVYADPWVDGRSNVGQLGVYVQDQLRYDKWILTLGGRHDWVVGTEIDNLAGSTQTTRDQAFTGRAGLGYVFDNGVAPYASYATSFQPVTGVYAPERGGGAFEPTTGIQYEVGVKYQPDGWNGFLSASLYEITQQHVSTNDPLYSGFTVQQGEIRSRGVELEGKAELTEELSLIASWALIGAEITKDNPAVGSATSSVGLRPKGVPRQTASAWGDYRFKSGALEGLGLGLGVRYVGTSENSGNTETIPDYALVDAAVRFDLGALHPDLGGASLALNVSNLADRKYYSAGFYDNTVLYGNRRQFLATLKYDW